MSSPNTMSKSDGVERREGRAKGVRGTARGVRVRALAGLVQRRFKEAAPGGRYAWRPRPMHCPQSRLSGFRGLCR